MEKYTDMLLINLKMTKFIMRDIGGMESSMVLVPDIGKMEKNFIKVIGKIVSFMVKDITVLKMVVV